MRGHLLARDMHLSDLKEDGNHMSTINVDTTDVRDREEKGRPDA